MSREGRDPGQQACARTDRDGDKKDPCPRYRSRTEDHQHAGRRDHGCPPPRDRKTGRLCPGARRCDPQGRDRLCGAQHEGYPRDTALGPCHLRDPHPRLPCRFPCLFRPGLCSKRSSARRAHGAGPSSCATTRSLEIKDLRGNVDTRIRKLSEGHYNAIVLAEAGLSRLGIRIPGERLPPEKFVPTPNQGTDRGGEPGRSLDYGSALASTRSPGDEERRRD